MHTNTEAMNHRMAVLQHPMHFQLLHAPNIGRISRKWGTICSLLLMFSTAAAWQSMMPQMLQNLLVSANAIFVCLKWGRTKAKN